MKTNTTITTCNEVFDVYNYLTVKSHESISMLLNDGVMFTSKSLTDYLNNCSEEKRVAVHVTMSMHFTGFILSGFYIQPIAKFAEALRNIKVTKEEREYIKSLNGGWDDKCTDIGISYAEQLGIVEEEDFLNEMREAMKLENENADTSVVDYAYGNEALEKYALSLAAYAHILSEREVLVYLG